MLKRAAAFLFVLLLAGQVWAGVCGCLEDGDHSRSSCCLRDKSDTASMNAVPCCESDCGDLNTQATPRSNHENGAKLVLENNEDAHTVAAAFKFIPFLARMPETAPAIGKSITRYRRPPNLYLFHHAFLI